MSKLVTKATSDLLLLQQLWSIWGTVHATCLVDGFLVVRGSKKITRSFCFSALIILDILIHWNVLSAVLLIAYLIPLIRYRQGKHLVDVTEIFNLLSLEKKQRLIKLFYLVFLLFLSIFWYGELKIALVFISWRCYYSYMCILLQDDLHIIG